MTKKRFALVIGIVGLACVGAWLVQRRSYEIVTVKRPEYDRRCSQPIMLDDETFTFRTETEGIYRVRHGQVELLSAPEPLIAGTPHELDDSYGIVGNKAYYVRNRESKEPEFVVCENGIETPVLSENERTYIRFVHEIDSDGTTVVFRANTGHNDALFSLRDGKLENIGEHYGVYPQPPKLVVKDRQGAIVEGELARRVFEESQRSFSRTVKLDDEIFRVELVEEPFEPSVSGSCERFIVGGDRFFCLTDEDLYVFGEGKVLPAVTPELRRPLKLKRPRRNQISASERTATFVCYSFDIEDRSTGGVYDFCDGELVRRVANTPIGEYGYGWQELATNGDQLVMIERNGYRQKGSRTELYSHRLAVRSGERSLPILTTDEQFDGGIVDDISIGSRGVSRGGNIAFVYRIYGTAPGFTGGGMGIALATPRRWEAPLGGLCLLPAGVGLVWSIISKLRNRRKATPSSACSSPAS